LEALTAETERLLETEEAEAAAEAANLEADLLASEATLAAEEET
jgi:hypothetical protein